MVLFPFNPATRLAFAEFGPDQTKPVRIPQSYTNVSFIKNISITKLFKSQAFAIIITLIFNTMVIPKAFAIPITL